MKKLSIFAALLLMMGFVSCVENDNPVIDQKTVNYDGENYSVDLIATFEAELGTEVGLTLGSWNEDGDVIGIDFGDGKLQSLKIGYKSQTIPDEEGTTHNAVETKGTVSGDGIVKLYGHYDIAFATLSGGVLPTTFNQEKLLNIEDLSITGADIESIEFPELAKLTTLKISNTPIKTADVSKLAALKTLSIVHTSVSAYEESPLESIDLSANTALETLVVGDAFYKPGILTSLDLSKNTALTSVSAGNNKIAAIKLPAGAALTTLTLAKNELTALDLSNLKSIKNIDVKENKIASLDFSKLITGGNIYVNDNELTALDLPVSVRALEAENNKIAKVSIKDATYSCKLANNCLTFSTLPTKPASLNTAAKARRFTYAPQDAVVPVKINAGAIDYKAEYGPFKGITDAENYTEITFNADGAEMPAENFEAKDGIVNFLHVYNVVYGTLTNAAFPDLTLTTTKFAVGFGAPVLYETLFTYDFAAEQALIAGGLSKPGNVGGNQNNGQGFFGWENAEKTDSKRNDYKAYKVVAGSQLPAECHMWRRADRYDQDASWANAGGLTCPNDREYAIDGLNAGYLVEIYYEGADEIVWAIGDGTSDNDGKVRATALINGAEAVTGETTIPSGAGILVKSVTPAVKGTGYIVFKVKKNMVISKVVISKPAE